MHVFMCKTKEGVLTSESDDEILSVPAFSSRRMPDDIMTGTTFLPMRILESIPIQEDHQQNADNSRSPLLSSSLTKPAAVDEKDDINNQADDLDIDNTVEKVIAYCATHNIANPVEILRCIQKEVVTGQPLEVTDITQCTKGKTNCIFVDRINLLPTAFDELKSFKDYHVTPGVQFYSEIRILFVKKHSPYLV